MFFTTEPRYEFLPGSMKDRPAQGQKCWIWVEKGGFGCGEAIRQEAYYDEDPDGSGWFNWTPPGEYPRDIVGSRIWAWEPWSS